jgi:ribosome-binding factor A
MAVIRSQRAQEVRRSKKKSFYLRELSGLLSRLVPDQPLLAQLYFSRVELSSDGGMCYVYCSFFNALDDEAEQELFKQAREILVLYRGSLRKALSGAMHARYVPDLRFFYDTKKEQERRVNSLLNQVGDEIREYDQSHDDEEEE